MEVFYGSDCQLRFEIMRDWRLGWCLFIWF